MVGIRVRGKSNHRCRLDVGEKVMQKQPSKQKAGLEAAVTTHRAMRDERTLEQGGSSDF